MYLISVVAVVVVSGLLMVMGKGDVMWFIDLPSLLVILLFDGMLLFGAGLVKDFNNAFRMGFGKGGEEGLPEIKRAIEAVALVRKTTLAAGVFSMVFSLILAMRYLADPERIGPTLAVASLTLLYALAVVLILLPLEARLKMKLQNLLQD